MRRWIAGISFCLAIILFGVAGLGFFHRRYCNAQRLNTELAATHRPVLLSEFIAQDHRRQRTEIVQAIGGCVLLVIAIVVWTGRPNPEKSLPRK